MFNSDQPTAVPSRSLHRSPSSFPATSANTARTPKERRMRRCRVSLATGIAILVTVGCVAARSEPAITQPVNAVAVCTPLANFVAEASQRFGIPAAWIRAVMRAESFGDVHAVSPKGAMGLMQIMPETWASLRQRYRLGADPFNAHDNIIAGAAYLRELHDRYGIPGFLAAYNAGPGRWEDHLATSRPLPAETRAYLIRLLPIVSGNADDDISILTAVVKSWTEASLFPSSPSTSSNDVATEPGTQPSRPLNDRRARDWTGLAPQSDGLFVALSNRGQPQ